MKLYTPSVQSHSAKVIPLHAYPLDEWVNLEEAAQLFKSPKHPNGNNSILIKLRHYKSKVDDGTIGDAKTRKTEDAARFQKVTSLLESINIKLETLINLKSKNNAA